jgi:hypothetical protein
MSERKGKDIPCGRKVEGNLIEQLEWEIGHQSRVRGKGSGARSFMWVRRRWEIRPIGGEQHMDDVIYYPRRGSATMYIACKMWSACTDIGRKREVLLDRG